MEQCEEFDLDNMKISNFANLQIPRIIAGTFEANNKIYVFGGNTNGLNKSQIEQHNMQKGTDFQIMHINNTNVLSG